MPYSHQIAVRIEENNILILKMKMVLSGVKDAPCKPREEFRMEQQESPGICLVSRIIIRLCVPN